MSVDALGLLIRIIYMLFKDLVANESIIGSLVSNTRNEVLAEMVDKLIKVGEIPADSREGILGALIEREEITSTGLGQGIAIPHAKHPTINKMIGLIARSKEGVDYDALDGKPVHLFVMLLSSQELIQQHLESLAYVAKNLNDPIFRSFILNAREEKEIVALLEEADLKG